MFYNNVNVSCIFEDFVVTHKYNILTICNDRVDMWWSQTIVIF